jgi:hypothetical protein
MVNRSTFVCSLLVALSLFGSTAAESQGDGTLIEVLTQSDEVVRFELHDIMPSQKGTALISLTRKPSTELGKIEWQSIPIRGYSPETAKIREVRIVGEPLRYKYPKYVNEFIFFPIVIVTVDGKEESWYWQGETLVGIANKREGTLDASLALSNVKSIRFLGPARKQ